MVKKNFFLGNSIHFNSLSVQCQDLGVTVIRGDVPAITRACLPHCT